MKFFCLGINHHEVPVDLREQVAIRPENLEAFCRRIKTDYHLTEAVALSTCNRVEIYGVTPEKKIPCAGLKKILLWEAKDPQAIEPHFILWEDAKAVEHLFEVTSGIDSMILGETEIFGQVKKAYELASSSGSTGKIINRIFQKSFQTAKQVRSRTNITKGNVSVSSVAVTLAEKIFGSLENLHVMIIGAGEISEKTARTFISQGVTAASIVNRSPEKAQQIARDLGISTHLLSQWEEKAVDVDIIVCSTSSPDLMIHHKDVESLMEQRKGRPLFLIDLAVPRDVDPAIHWLDDCYLYNIDDLQAIADSASIQRTQEITLCRDIIQSKTNSLSSWLLSS